MKSLPVLRRYDSKRVASSLRDDDKLENAIWVLVSGLTLWALGAALFAI